MFPLLLSLLGNVYKSDYTRENVVVRGNRSSWPNGLRITVPTGQKQDLWLTFYYQGLDTIKYWRVAANRRDVRSKGT